MQWDAWMSTAVNVNIAWLCLIFSCSRKLIETKLPFFSPPVIRRKLDWEFASKALSSEVVFLFCFAFCFLLLAPHQATFASRITKPSPSCWQTDPQFSPTCLHVWYKYPQAGIGILELVCSNGRKTFLMTYISRKRDFRSFLKYIYLCIHTYTKAK